MAREKQVDQSRSTAGGNKNKSDADTPATSATDRERNIQTARDQGTGSRTATSSSLARAQSGPIGTLSASPFALMRRMAEDMDRLFGHFGLGRSALTLPSLFSGDDFWSTPTVQRSLAWSPQVEMFERDGKTVVRADLPGLDKDNVNVEVDDGVLTISGERKDEHEENREGFYRSERSYGQFYRAIPLPDGVNPDDLDASFKDGVLEVTFNTPKELQQKGKKIDIR